MKQRALIFCLCLTSFSLWGGAVQAETYSNFIFRVPTVTYTGGCDEVVGKLEKQCARIVSENNHTLLSARLWGTANQLLWGRGQAVAGMAATLPYLSAGTAAGLTNYLAGEVVSNLMNTTYLTGSEQVGSIDYDGTSTFGIQWCCNVNRAFLWDALYGIWAYAHYSGDWDLISNNWSSVVSVYNFSQTGSTRVMGTEQGWDAEVLPGLNNEISGSMAMARMSRKVGDYANETNAQAVAESLMSTKITDMIMSQTNPVIRLGSGLGRFLVVSNYNDITPDLGRFLSSNVAAEAATHMAVVTNRFRTWFMSDMDHVSDWMSRDSFPPVAQPDLRPGEEGFQMSLFASPIYMVQAYVQKVPTDTLWDNLPLGQSSYRTPHYLDIHRLNHMVALLRRFSTSAWAEEERP